MEYWVYFLKRIKWSLKVEIFRLKIQKVRQEDERNLFTSTHYTVENVKNKKGQHKVYQYMSNKSYV